jgi:Ycf66 protein N-terminus
MLNHLLAGIVALGSLVLFLSGFFFPEVQRKPDLAWSGVALLYALLLFAEGDRTSGGALLGHIASVALILWFGWQTLQQRRQFATVEAQTAIPNSLEALTPFLKEGWGRMTIAYREASSWVQDRLGKDDTGIVPEALTQQSQDWDDPSTASKPVDSAAAVESTAPLTTEEASESLVASGEPEQVSGEPASPEVSDGASEVEMENAAISAHPESADTPPTPFEVRTVNTEESPEAKDTNSEIVQQNTDDVSGTEDSLPANSADPANLTESPAASTHPDDDGSWPPPDPIT